MAITFTYPIVAPKIDDLVIGTQTPDPLSSETDTPTRNFTIQSIVDLVAAGGGTGISLLTDGTSGVSTLTAGVLNIPNYTADPSIVKTTGNQTIGGAKIFTSNIYAPNLSGDNNGDQSLSLSGQVLTISGTGSNVTLPVGGVVSSLDTQGTTGAATLTAGVLNIPNYADNNTEYSLTVQVASGTAATLTGTVFNIPTPVIPSVPFETLDTQGTSGPATLSAGVLNIPNYNSASGNFLPLAGGEMTGAITSATAANLIVQPGTSILEVKGDGSSVDGGIVLNCYANTHGQTLKSQPHSESITNTMLLPKGASSTLVSEATETGVTTAYSATAASTGSPLTPSIAGRALTLTSNSYQGGSNVGYVPSGGSATTFLRGDGTWVTPASGGGGAVDSVNGATGTVVLNTGDITEYGNLYYTEARVSGNTNVVANTAKVGYTEAAVSANTNVTANTAKTGITSVQSNAIVANTAKVGITSAQANEIVANTTKVGITSAQASAITANTAKVGITTAQATDITDSVKNDTDTYATDKVTNIITLTQGEYNAIVAAGTLNVNTLYIII